MLPDVQSVSPNIGTYTGQRITIAGAGFLTNTSVVSVTVNGTICDVATSTINQIVCDLREKNISDDARLDSNHGSQSDGFFSGVGLKYRRYGIGGLGNKSPAGLRNAINSGSNSISLVEDSYRG